MQVKKDAGELSQYSSVLEDRQRRKSKTKKCVWGTLGLLVVAAIIVVVVLVVKNNEDDGGDDGGGGGNDPENNDPLTYVEYNSFIIDPNTPIESQDWYFNGVLENNQVTDPKYSQMSTTEFLKEKKQVYNRLQKEQSADGAEKMVYRPINPQNVVKGENNKVPKQVNFNFSLIDNYEARVQLTSTEGQNYSVTDRTFHRFVQTFEARFTQLGFEHSGPGEPFYWSLTNIFNG